MEQGGSFCWPASNFLASSASHLAFLPHRCGQRTVSEGLNTLALKDGTGPEQAAHSAKRCFLNRLETTVASNPNRTFRILILLACLHCQLPTSLLRLLRLAPGLPSAQMRSKDRVGGTKHPGPEGRNEAGASGP